MSGIYFHIPFCKQRCNYCDFYKSLNVNKTDAFLKGLLKEITLRKDYIETKEVKTIYFGGGTPSLINCDNISRLLDAVSSIFIVHDQPEITLEANPDDLTFEYLTKLKEIGINRLSIGIQSFSDHDLKQMGRRHNSDQAVLAVKNAQKAGFTNISVDLIYGIPGMLNSQWEDNLDKVFELNVQHLSAYHLTFHENTVFGDRLKKGVIKEIDEKQSLQQYELLINKAEENHFIQYEISNFALEGFFSKHNSSYWDQTEYLGLGPSAHSFNKKTRYWSVSDIDQYISRLNEDILPGEFENLTNYDRFNDYIIIRLRTIWGVDAQEIKKEFGDEFYDHVMKMTRKYSLTGNVINNDEKIRISPQGLFISDQIISDYLYLKN